MHKDESQNSPYCLYPPTISSDVDVTEQSEGDTLRYVIRNRRTAQYFQFKSPEFKIFQQLNGAHHLALIASGGSNQSSPKVSLPTLIKFVSKLEALGLLAHGGQAAGLPKPTEKGLYPTFRLFNPDHLLTWLDGKFGWVFTSQFVIASLLLFGFVSLGILLRATEFADYVAYTYSTYGLVTILLFTLVITALHEFAHGLACKHFGGDVKEMGVLMIFYVMPAFYCNITDIYRIGRRRERLWVIGAGIYWQLLISTLAALVWLLATPFTVLADFAFLVFFGGTFNILVNCNPLIKLDGYYALAQFTGVQNLQTQSADYVGSLFNKLLFIKNEKPTVSPRPLLFIGYWLGSVLYSLLLIFALVNWAGDWLIQNLGFFGILLTLYLFALLTQKWWKPSLAAIVRASLALILNPFTGDGKMSNQETTQNRVETTGELRPAAPPKAALKRRLLVKGAIALLLLAALITPWEASSSSDCTLQLPPGHEGVARANVNAVLAEVFVHPGDAVAEGTRLARLANPDLEDRLTQINADIKRLEANNSRLEDEIKVRSELMLSASFKETERKRMLAELQTEASQIKSASANSASSLPPALAVLQAEIELKQTVLEHNVREVERYKKLYDQQLVGAQIYDRAVAAMKISEKEVQSASARLEAAFVEHRRLTSSTATTSLVAETESRAARSNFDALLAELSSNRQQLTALKQRQEILQREYDGMMVIAPRSGVILGEDLRKQIGSHFNMGQEICRIGELEKFLLRIDVSEREISEVKLASSARFKLKTVPGKTFTGRVAKINAEPNTNQNGQRFYPVEVLVENADGMLRPGMTGFARISFGRQSVGLILADKVWQALRPELWLF
ncbi:MAG: efflux RND transporter periplasmic adaptor subunit [Acidobacteria bacterium]|nr:efflux RND transporter periplasmic adaptor subunit [Acidobacteriota bacterium]